MNSAIVETTDDETRLSRVFFALADSTRRSTLSQLSNGSATVGELAEPYSMSGAAFSKHIKVLQSAGLVIKELDGRNHRCSLRPEGMQDAAKWIAIYNQFWSSGLDGLEKFLSQSQKGKKKPTRKRK